MERVNGVHHITAIGGPPQENADFYAGVLGMRMVKKTVNQDDPGTYHLFYADAEGNPGTDLTFFTWSELAPPRLGHGLAIETALEVPQGSLEAWSARLDRYGIPHAAPETRFGDRVMTLVDPHGMPLALVESQARKPRRSVPWDGSEVPAKEQIRGLFGARLWEREADRTGSFLQQVLGFERLGVEGGWTRWGFSDAAGVVDIMERTDVPRGAWGRGCVHHLAWSVRDEAHELAMRERVTAAGGRPTEVIDRFWFKSVYFLEPGGVLFELATEGPGFSIDEDASQLGTRLVLPPFLEPQRARIEQVLPEVHAPAR